HHQRQWELRVTPYYTRVNDYIDAVARPGFAAEQFNVLQYANQSARLYGLDVSGRLALAATAWGQWGLSGLLNYTRGENRDTGDHLYNIMPLNARVSLTHQYGGWDNALEWVGVKGKKEVSDARNEIKTPGYGLVNLRSGHAWQKLRVDVGVENLFDRMYYLPLGGAYVGEGATMSFNKEAGNVARSGMGLSGTQSMWGTAVPGMGRSIYAGISYSF
ncbi:MAG: TonB-dependent receptor, partial [Pseudomonadales bacterium]|nr:TonB-dependent receptor [Pseudomonadales bacterium]